MTSDCWKFQGRNDPYIHLVLWNATWFGHNDSGSETKCGQVYPKQWSLWHHIFNVGLQPGLIASDEATDLWQRTKESFRVLLFLDRNHEGFGREDHRTFCRFFKLRFRAKEHKTCLCESCSINIGCVKKKMVVAQSLMFQLVDSCRKISYAPLVTITLTLKTKLIFVVWYGWTFAPSCWSFRKHQGPKREPRAGFIYYKDPFVCGYSLCNQKWKLVFKKDTVKWL